MRPYSEALSEMNLQESRILLSKISTHCLTFLIPFVVINVEFWQWISSEFSNPAKQWLLFFQPVRKYKYEQYDNAAGSSFLNITCQMKFDTSAWKTISNMRNIRHCLILRLIGRKTIRNMCRTAFLPFLQEIRMRRSKRGAEHRCMISQKKIPCSF